MNFDPEIDQIDDNPDNEVMEWPLTTLETNPDEELLGGPSAQDDSLLQSLSDQDTGGQEPNN